MQEPNEPLPDFAELRASVISTIFFITMSVGMGFFAAATVITAMTIRPENNLSLGPLDLKTLGTALAMIPALLVSLKILAPKLKEIGQERLTITYTKAYAITMLIALLLMMINDSFFMLVMLIPPMTCLIKTRSY